MTHRSPATFVLALPLLLLLPAGCKRQKEPEVLKQRRAQELQHEKRQKLMKEGKLPNWVGSPHAQDEGKHEHGQSEPPRPLPLEDVDDSKWPNEVKATTIRLRKAFGAAVPGLSLQLVQYGPPAFEAMRFLIRQRRQPKTKLAMLAMLLAEAQMFRPKELAEGASDPLMPYLQRAAIERLAWLKDDTSQGLLKQLRAREKPMAEFIDNASRQRGPRYSVAQLKTLDTILHDRDLETIKKALLATHDFSLEEGLFAILYSRGARRVVKGLVAKRLIGLAAAGDRQRLREYAAQGNNLPLLRVAAAQELLRSKEKKDQDLLKKIAAQEKDPMAPLVKRMLAGEGEPSKGATGP